MGPTANEPSRAQVFVNAAVAGWNLGAGVGLLLFGSLILLHTMISPTVSLATKSLILAVCLPIPLFLLLRLARGGVVCDRRGIIIRNPLGHIHLSWDEVDHFEQRRGTRLANTAWACKTDGSSVHIYGIVTSVSRMAALQGEPIIEALNRRLAAQRLADAVLVEDRVR